MVRFVAGQKDAICSSCAIGEHCETVPPQADMRFLTAIRRLARDGDMQEALVESETMTGGAKRPSPAIELPAWAAKRILSNLDFHAQTYPRFFRPFARIAVHNAMKTA
jgi:hypothetical protein